jgi:hypothetical protein
VAIWKAATITIGKHAPRSRGPPINLRYSKEKHKFEEAQRGGARKAKTARTEDGEKITST